MFQNQTTPRADGKSFRYLLYFAFLVSGIVTVLIGQILPILAIRLQINDKQAGYFFISQFSGSLAGTFLSQLLIRRYGFKNSTIVGLILMGIGVFGLNADSLFGCLLAFFVNGIGIGITLPSINMLMVELNPLNTTSSLNILNFFWGVGAIFCKPFIDLTADQTNTRLPLSILSLLLIATSLTMVFAKEQRILKPVAAVSNQDRPPIWTTSTAWLLAFFGFVHVGFESAIGGWISTYGVRVAGESNLGTLLTPTFCYFLFFVIGRGVSPAFAKFLSDNHLISISLLIICLGILILLAADGYWGLVIGASIAGFGTSAVFPTNISRFTKAFGETATSRATPIFISGTIGSMLSTFLIGFISESYNDLRSGMTVLLFLGVSLLLIQLLIYFDRRSKP